MEVLTLTEIVLGSITGALAFSSISIFLIRKSFEAQIH